MSRTVDISATDLAIVRTILRTHLPANTRVFVFGSRATGTARRYSDLDLALEPETPLDFAVIGEITEAFSQSELPYKVDVIDLSTVDRMFLTNIEQDLIALPL